MSGIIRSTHFHKYADLVVGSAIMKNESADNKISALVSWVVNKGSHLRIENWSPFFLELNILRRVALQAFPFVEIFGSRTVSMKNLGIAESHKCSVFFLHISIKKLILSHHVTRRSQASVVRRRNAD